MRFISAERIHSGHSFFPAGSVLVLDDNGVVLDVKPKAETGGGKVEFFDGIICPGLINTHCHLELSHMKGKVAEGTGLHAFILEIEKLKKPADEEVQEAIASADKEMFENGIVAVGDICNTSATFSFKKQSKIFYHNFLEVYSFDPSRSDAAFARGTYLAGQLEELGLKKYSVTPHAPYSVSVSLLRRIADHASEKNSILSIHNQESPDEDLFFKFKTGQVIERLKHFGISADHFSPTGKSSLQSYLLHLPRDLKILLVHNTFTGADDLQFAAEYNKDICWCLCPNANLYIENTLPDIRQMEAARCKITLGTDSYASNHSLSLTDEINTILKNFSSVSLETVLKWATFNGARFLEMDHKLGSFEKGRQPGITLLKQDKISKKYSSKKVV
jgi:aminodeoxyfutalosine deaminase